MHDLSLKIPQAVNFGPRDVVEATTCADENIRAVFEHVAIRSPYLNMPFALILVVAAVEYLMA